MHQSTHLQKTRCAQCLRPIAALKTRLLVYHSLNAKPTTSSFILLAESWRDETSSVFKSATSATLKAAKAECLRERQAACSATVV